jgi:hypothetical protein
MPQCSVKARNFLRAEIQFAGDGTLARRTNSNLAASPSHLTAIRRHMNKDPFSRLKNLMRAEQCAKIFAPDLNLDIDEIAQEDGALDGPFENIVGEGAWLTGTHHALRSDNHEDRLVGADFGSA